MTTLLPSRRDLEGGHGLRNMQYMSVKHVNGIRPRYFPLFLTGGARQSLFSSSGLCPEQGDL
jgi:hypothetical protein